MRRAAVIRHPLRILGAAILLTFFLLLAFMLDDAYAQSAASTTSPTPLPKPTAAPPPPIKASEVLANAQRWVGVPYRFGGYSEAGFDCSGYISRVWNIPRRTTDNIDDMVVPITREQLLPGDILNVSTKNDPNQFGHMRLFDKWANQEKTLMWIFEATEPEVMHRVMPYDARYTPMRRINIVSDVPMPPPPPLPANWNKPPPRSTAPAPTATPPPTPAPTPVPPANLVGRIADSATGEPVPGVRVFYWTSRQRYTVISTVTNAEGRYRIENIAPDIYEMAVHGAGYEIQFRGGVNLRMGGTGTVDVKLVSTAGPSGALPADARPARDPTTPETLPVEHAIP
ncbi:MAG TPA: carboxypeptidase regulatory-like domain-containing protein, partial [Methylomirabilota bacterium]|nr:carboxypeptidase regulatory-like domain-containing protein [Methylomirabilota bacterium]